MTITDNVHGCATKERRGTRGTWSHKWHRDRVAEAGVQNALHEQEDSGPTVCSSKPRGKVGAQAVLWCNIRANAGGMLVLWKNAEKGASSSSWLECAALEQTTWGFGDLCIA